MGGRTVPQRIVDCFLSNAIEVRGCRIVWDGDFARVLEAAADTWAGIDRRREF